MTTEQIWSPSTKNAWDQVLHSDLSKAEKMAWLQERFSNIDNHPFHDFAKNKIVYGVGNLDAKLVFVGEGPGKDEDMQGEPFVGRAGQLLTKIITAMGFSRKDVYISNIIKCRLANNRPPEPEEIEYEKKLMILPELDVIQPQIVCLLGASAMYAFLGHSLSISKARGEFFPYKGYKLIPTYHPAYLLRNPAAKAIVWQDMLKIKQNLI